VAEGADVPLSRGAPSGSSTAAVCVAAVLCDPLRRVAVLGGRDGMPRSLGSVYGGALTRFLGGDVRGFEQRVIEMPRLRSHCSGVAVRGDGATLLVADNRDFVGGYVEHSETVFEYSVADGTLLRTIGSLGCAGPLQFQSASQLWIASDGFVFVADTENHRVQVLSPDLGFHGFVGDGRLQGPRGVCANSDVVVVSEAFLASLVSVFRRRDGALLRRFGDGSVDGAEVVDPRGVCFVNGDSHIAVADRGGSRVSVFTVDGALVRHIGVGVLSGPHSVACSAFDELVVADTFNSCTRVFSVDGDVLMTVGVGDFTGVAVHGGVVFAVDRDGERCVVWG
jgi:DNA-binding beta-propeller fold protein YncE